jgi:hypothetical protein
MSAEKRTPILGPAGDVMAKYSSRCGFRAKQHAALPVRATLVMAFLASALLVSAPTASATADFVGATNIGVPGPPVQSSCDTPWWVPKPPDCPA